MAGEVFTEPVKESAVITQPTNNVTLLNDLRADLAQHKRGGRHIPKRQTVHTMANNLAAESALSDDPRLGQALMQRYGANHFSSDSLIDFVGEGKLLQRQGVDFITPQQQLIDLKMRPPFPELTVKLDIENAKNSAIKQQRERSVARRQMIMSCFTKQQTKVAEDINRETKLGLRITSQMLDLMYRDGVLTRERVQVGPNKRNSVYHYRKK